MGNALCIGVDLDLSSVAFLNATHFIHFAIQSKKCVVGSGSIATVTFQCNVVSFIANAWN